MLAHRDRFGMLSETPREFDQYVAARRHPCANGRGEWGDDPEIRAMEEMLDRPFEVCWRCWGCVRVCGCVGVLGVRVCGCVGARGLELTP